MSTFAEGFIKYGLDKGHIKPKEENQKELDLIWASSFYLTEDLPKNFGKWSEKKLNKFLVDHAWQPFEYYEADDIWEHIERLADQGRTYFERNLSKALGYKLKDDGTIYVKGGGMDMGYHVVSTLSRVLYGSENKIKHRWL
jgi:hypothetical protein